MADREEDKEREKGFRIVDRRRFTSEGETRNDVPDPPPSSPTPSMPPPRQEPSKQSPLQAPGPDKRPQGRGGDPRQAPRPEPRSAPPPQPEPEPAIDFLSFAASLATNALAALGLLPEEQARGLPRNPELAREYIDILAMLQQKTKGNLSRQEDVALDQMLADLRMQYVQLTRGRR
jgi:hypothetical protein